MKSGIENLTAAEKDFLYQVPAMIAILIAGADNDLDEKERTAAVELTKYKKLGYPHPLVQAYYAKVFDDFENHLYGLIKEYPGLAELRNPIIMKQLEQLNTIFPKLTNDFSSELYKSFRQYAMQVAESSGGLLGFFSVGHEEKEWLSLPGVLDPGAAA